MTIEGDFIDGMIYGDAEIIYSNGKIVKGTFREGIKHGIIYEKTKQSFSDKFTSKPLFEIRIYLETS